MNITLWISVVVELCNIAYFCVKVKTQILQRAFRWYIFELNVKYRKSLNSIRLSSSNPSRVQKLIIAPASFEDILYSFFTGYLCLLFLIIVSGN